MNPKTKKYLVLFSVFIVPLIFFLFLALGRVHFKKLPVLTEKIKELLPSNFSEKITILSFLDECLSSRDFYKIMNLYQVTYKKTKKYKKFQIVTLYPENISKNTLRYLEKELMKVGAGNLSKWHFLSKSTLHIQNLFKALQVPNISLKDVCNVSKVFIIDENLNLRGRTDDKDSKNGILFAYETTSISSLKNKLNDDLKVLLYESKFAKKSNEK